MRKLLFSCVLVFLFPVVGAAQETKVFRWVDAEGILHYGDSIPVEFSEFPKDVLNERGVVVGVLAGKKTEAQLAAEKIETERRVVKELQQRADQTLLATYLTVEEILMHRDRRIELFHAQSKVTELYLSNLNHRLVNIRAEAAKYRPYSKNSNAPMIPDGLAEELHTTKETIARHERNLQKFLADEQQIIIRFAGDITRFKFLKGIDQD